MKSALGMAHPAPVNGGNLALGPDHVTLRHLSILLIDLVTGIAAHLAVDMRERAPFARALAVVAGQAQDLDSFGEAIVPKPAAAGARLGISAEQLLAVC
jgi:hypothetical protein